MIQEIRQERINYEKECGLAEILIIDNSVHVQLVEEARLETYDSETRTRDQEEIGLIVDATGTLTMFDGLEVSILSTDEWTQRFGFGTFRG